MRDVQYIAFRCSTQNGYPTSQRNTFFRMAVCPFTRFPAPAVIKLLQCVQPGLRLVSPLHHRGSCRLEKLLELKDEQSQRLDQQLQPRLKSAGIHHSSSIKCPRLILFSFFCGSATENGYKINYNQKTTWFLFSESARPRPRTSDTVSSHSNTVEERTWWNTNDMMGIKSFHSWYFTII